MVQLHSFGKHEPIVGERVFIAPGAQIIGQVELGDNSAVFHNAVLRADINSIKIGENSNIQDNSTLHVSDDHGVVVGKGVVVGHNVILHACVIGDNCTIGMGAIVIDGAEIGEDSIVGAGSLVTKGKKFPPRSLILGNPAKWVRELNDEEIESTRKMAEKYVRVKNTFLKTEPSDF